MEVLIGLREIFSLCLQHVLLPDSYIVRLCLQSLLLTLLQQSACRQADGVSVTISMPRLELPQLSLPGGHVRIPQGSGAATSPARSLPQTPGFGLSLPYAGFCSSSPFSISMIAIVSVSPTTDEFSKELRRFLVRFSVSRIKHNLSMREVLRRCLSKES